MQRIDTSDSPRFVATLQPTAQAYPVGAPPVALFHPELGVFGQYGDGHIARNPRAVSASAWRALCRDEQRFLHLLRARDARTLDRLTQMAQVTSFDAILNQRRNGHGDDLVFTKASQTTVANTWSNFGRGGGHPGAMSYASIPGGSCPNAISDGAPPIRAVGAGLKKFLLNVGVNHQTGANVVILVDILMAAGGVSATVATAQTVNSAALTRYSGADSAGNMMIAEVTTALGATAQNLTVTSYTNQAGTTARATAAQALTASAITFRLQPTAAGILIPLATGDKGVRSIEEVQLSAANSAGALAMLIFRQLVAVPTIATSSFVERSTPAALAGMAELVRGSDGECGCLAPFVLAGSTATGVQTYTLNTVEES